MGRATSAGGGTATRSRGSTAAAMGIWVRRWDWEAVSKDGPQQSESRSSRERGERDRWVRRTPKSKSGGCSGGGDWEAVMMAKASRRLLKKGMQTPKKVESGSSANRSNNGPEQSESREQVERETKDRCRERASKIGKPAWPTDGQYKVDEKRGPRSGRAKNVESSVSDDRSSEGVTARVDQGQTEGGTMSRATSAMAKRT